MIMVAYSLSALKDQRSKHLMDPAQTACGSWVLFLIAISGVVPTMLYKEDVLTPTSTAV
jgi:hypothetical protein